MTLLKKIGFFFILITGLSSFFSCKKENSLAVTETADTTTKIIVVLGSSSAFGYGASTPDSAWVYRLKKKLVIDGKKANVVNLAIPGYTTYQVLPSGKVPPALRPKPDDKQNVTKALSYHPGLVIINLPSNDIASNYSDDEIVNNYKTITNVLDSDKITYIITGTHPRNIPDVYTRTRLRTFSDTMAKIYGVSMCIYYDKISDPNGYILPKYAFTDGIHLNDAGHAIIYNAILSHSYLKTYLKY